MKDERLITYDTALTHDETSTICKAKDLNKVLEEMIKGGVTKYRVWKPVDVQVRIVIEEKE